MGTDNGLLLISKNGRIWFPSENTLAANNDMKIKFENDGVSQEILFVKN